MLRSSQTIVGIVRQEAENAVRRASPRRGGETQYPAAPMLPALGSTSPSLASDHVDDTNDPHETLMLISGEAPISFDQDTGVISLTGSAGVTDHGELTGLLDNDHPQYSLTTHNHNGVYATLLHAAQHASGGGDPITPAAIGAALVDHLHTGVYSLIDHIHDERYSLLGHNHDGVYSLVDHLHDERYAIIAHTHTGVYSPAAHAAQHASGGSDPVTPAAIGASAVGHNHDATYLKLTGGTVAGSLTITKDSSGHDSVLGMEGLIHAEDSGMPSLLSGG